LLEDPEESQKNAQDTESGWHHDSSTVMLSQFGFSGTSLFKLQTDLHEAEKSAWHGPFSRTCVLLQDVVCLLSRRWLLTII